MCKYDEMYEMWLMNERDIFRLVLMYVNSFFRKVYYNFRVCLCYWDLLRLGRERNSLRNSVSPRQVENEHFGT